MNVLLIGPRGSGKSTVGKLLADRLDRVFVDLDNEVLKQFTQSTVTDIWNKLCESAWRNAEHKVLEKLLNSDDQVIALGGGAPMIPQVKECLQLAQEKELAIVIYLRCSVDVLMDRLQSSPGDRPSLTGADPVDEINVVLIEREPTYQELADVQIDASRSPGVIVSDLLSHRQLSGSR